MENGFAVASCENVVVGGRRPQNYFIARQAAIERQGSAFPQPPQSRDIKISLSALALPTTFALRLCLGALPAVRV